MTSALHELRREYVENERDALVALDDPLEHFAHWFQAAVRLRLREPNAMTLATADERGRPSARVVLLKNFDRRGFVFSTNYNSRKGAELAANPTAALLFWWPELERQVRVEGPVSRVSAEESDAIFLARPRNAQLGAWASDQSHVIPGREAVIDQAMAAALRFGQQAVPRPPHWGGYRVAPESLEFWVGRRDRLHDRLRYVRFGETWKTEILAP